MAQAPKKIACHIISVENIVIYMLSATAHRLNISITIGGFDFSRQLISLGEAYFFLIFQMGWIPKLRVVEFRICLLRVNHVLNH